MAAFVTATPTRRIDVLGDDRLRYLEDVTSQHLTEVPTTHVRSALVLDTHGAPTAMFDVVVLGDRLALLVPDDEVATVVTDVLAMRTFLLDARFEPREGASAALRGEDAKSVASAAGLTVVDGRCRVAGDLLLVSRGDGLDLFGPPQAVEDAVAGLVAAGAERGTSDDLETWRIRAGQPAWGREVVAPHLPEELGLLPSNVHLAKGCYPGQEAVARMWMLGRPRRRLAVLAVEGEVAAGWRAGSGRASVEVTSVTPSGDEALGFVPADVEPGATFSDEGAAGGVRVLRVLGNDPNPPGHDPAMRQRRDRAPASR